DGGHDNALGDGLRDLGVADVGRVLGADQHRIHAHRAAVGVFDRHLALAVGPQPGQSAVATGPGQLARQVVRQVDGHRHQHVGLVAGEAEHHALVASADFFDLVIGHFAGFVFQGMVHAQGDVGALAGDGRLHAAGIAVEAFLAAVIADVFDHAPHQLV